MSIRTKYFLACMALAATVSISPALGTSVTHQSPAFRNCRISGGQAWALAGSGADGIEFCSFGSGMIGADSLYAFTVLSTNNKAVREYLKNSSVYNGNAANYCAAAGGLLKNMTDESNTSYSICSFRDGSAIEANTLAQGVNSIRNAELTYALHSNR